LLSNAAAFIAHKLGATFTLIDCPVGRRMMEEAMNNLAKERGLAGEAGAALGGGGCHAIEGGGPRRQLGCQLSAVGGV
jgi:hypothetical protein